MRFGHVIAYPLDGQLDSSLAFRTTGFSNRQFTVSINNTDSSTKPVLAGIPQTSVIAPHLFNLYTTVSKKLPQLDLRNPKTQNDREIVSTGSEHSSPKVVPLLTHSKTRILRHPVDSFPSPFFPRLSGTSTDAPSPPLNCFGF
ncbi:hypothetical protein CEXT_761821 [Caerostris extrusa]|uniref:Reverse transcriptase domain-containing protein n=1 Tax=Caerostris extrusa TaxID=172846 RepID=A0AAV4QJD2_CAEEX|nr:hypothetical protein CEXT_761821 [Caerostris extrusa]